ncbi:MAG: Ycf48-like protein [Phycisphaerae bacterium]|nr:Ycf48-like protein [Phycisphaerae bacterium]
MMPTVRTAPTIGLLILAGCAVPHVGQRAAKPPKAMRWEVVTPGPAVSLRGVGAVSARVVWASGADGTFLRSDDAGRTWRIGRVPGCEALDFRDLHAFDENRALLVNAGEPARIVETSDGGISWTIRHRDERTGIFFDSLAFWDDERGLAIGDPLDGQFVAIATSDGGRHWSAASALPTPLPGEACFAASGTALTVAPPESVWVATGGGAAARVLRSSDQGRSWSVSDSPLAAGGASRGIFSIAFRDAAVGVIVGGDYRSPACADAVAACTRDGGASWKLSSRPPGGYRSCVAFVPSPRPTWIAVGPSGSDVSLDNGQTWTAFSSTGFHALSVAPDGACWAVGSDGCVARLQSNREISLYANRT